MTASETTLVTGATGFIGSHLVSRLFADNVSVRVLVRPSSSEGVSFPDPVERAFGDLGDIGSLHKAVSGVHTVIHAAALISHSGRDRQRMWETNVEGTSRLITAARQAGVRRFVHVSSVVTIGSLESEGAPLDESSPFTETKVVGYSDSKREAELRVLDAASRNEIHAVIVNPATVYGPGDIRKSTREFQRKIMGGNLRFYPKGGVNVVSVHDVVQGILAARDVGRGGHRYILGGDNVHIRELFEAIAHWSGTSPPSVELPPAVLRTIGVVGSWAAMVGIPFPIDYEGAVTATRFHWFSSEKAKRELGYAPRPWNEAVRESVLSAIL